MKERSIVCYEHEVRAILEGRQTMLRRIAKPRNSDLPGDVHPEEIMARCSPCPYGVPGDRLWGKETWRDDSADIEDGEVAVYYRADYTPEDCAGHWRPSVHMPRAFSRISLEVTAIRCERLKGITEEDALAEGCTPLRDRGLRSVGGGDGWNAGDGARDDFLVRWDSRYMCGPYRVELSPWVWVVSFKVVQP